MGNIKTARILIEDGAYFKGGIEVVKAEPKAAPRLSSPFQLRIRQGPSLSRCIPSSGLPKEDGEPHPTADERWEESWYQDASRKIFA